VHCIADCEFCGCGEDGLRDGNRGGMGRCGARRRVKVPYLGKSRERGFGFKSGGTGGSEILVLTRGGNANAIEGFESVGWRTALQSTQCSLL
jgi:hypothetical protein